jgi:hypothetical protein
VTTNRENKPISIRQGAVELAQVEASMRVYYDNLSQAQREEDAAWGKLGEAALVALASEKDR